MPDQKEGIMLGLFTPQGPIFVGFSIEGFSKFVEMLNAVLDNAKGGTPVPQVFIDAFKEEEDNANTD